MKLLWKVTGIILITLLCFEIFLHFYNPFSAKGNQQYPSSKPNARYEFKDFEFQGLDKAFKHTKNKLGFRGKELPEGTDAKKIICMGGAATECFYLSDGHDWPTILGTKFQQSDSNIWLNNAGRAGSSAADNLAFLKKNVLKLKPDFIFLTCGLDDIGHAPTKSILPDNSWLAKAYRFLEIPKIFAKSENKTDINKFEILDLKKAEMLEMNDSQILQRIAMEQPLIGDFRKSLQEFIELCKTNKIRLVLISPVILFGDEKDLVSDINLGNIKVGDINGRAQALLLKQYNKATFEIAEANKIRFINLSARLPKHSPYFYDGFHFSDDGAEMVATIIFDESKDLIEK